MNITAEDIAAAVGVMALLGGIFKGYRAFIQMKEHIKTLFKKVEDIKAEKDHDIQELKDLFKSVRTEISELKIAQQEGLDNLVKSNHEMHIRLMEKISEIKNGN